jgi:ER membrane protein complex subunit 2
MGVRSHLKQLRTWREEIISGKCIPNTTYEREICRKVCRLAQSLIQNHAASCGSELYVICEQYVEACLILAEQRDDCIVALQILSKKFGEHSPRVGRLWAMKAESDGDFDRAIQICDEILQQHPTNVMTMKRKIAILKSRGHLIAAIDHLVEYLDVFMNDTEAWIELCELYREMNL